MPDHNNADLFAEFLQRVHDNAIHRLNLDVQPHQIPNTIQWGPFGQPHLYTFDAARARREGLDAVVRDAMHHIAHDMP